MSVSGHFSEKESAGEIQVLAKKYGWEAKPLTYRDVQKMNSKELRFHELFNKTELEKALAEPQTQAADKRSAKAAKTEQYWTDGRATEESVAEVQKFITRHPQFRGDVMSNRTALVDALKEQKLPVTQANLTEAFQMLAREGRLTLNPSAVGLISVRTNGQTISIRQEDLSVHQRRDKNLTVLEPETAISGSRLARHALLDILLSPHSPAIQERREQAALSANDYKKQNPEAFAKRTPALVEQKFQQATATFLSFHPEYVPTEQHRKHIRAYIEKRHLPYNINSIEAAYTELVAEGYIKPNSESIVSAGGGTRMVDYGGRPRSGRENLSAKVNKMSAKEYQDALQDPEFRAQVDAAIAH